MKQDCGYYALVQNIDYFRTGHPWHEPTRCPIPAAFYVSLKVPAGDFEAELLRNLCAEHDEQVRKSFPEAWRWSRSTTETDAQGWHRKFGGTS